ncbi:glycosyl hydrolase [Plantactinospora sp. B5E13]|uniref:glycosyl hydrolase n=1 Tax=Plantactinospora sp. B5E13 TaxID=3153758 RepID=UPI00325C97FB
MLRTISPLSERALPRRTLALLTSLAAVAALLSVPQPAAADPGPVVIGDFEQGTTPWFPVTTGGATATLTTTTNAPAGGTAAARIQANAPSGTVEMARGIPSLDLRRLDLSVRSAQLTGLVLRLVDSTGQAHQQTLALSPGTQWQQLSVTTFAGGTQYIHWGGANDGVWHGPLKQISLLIDAFRISPGPAVTLDVDDVVVQGPPPLAIKPTTLGNVFTTGDTVSFGVDTAATSLRWSARDAYGGVVATGSGTPAQLGNTISLGTLGTGWYTVDITAVQPDGTTVNGGTDVSVLPATTVRERRIGAATHYGGLWPGTSAPLLGKAGLGFARDEAYWSEVERVRGTYVFPARVESATAALRATDVDFLQILDYGNALYHAGEAPATDAGRAGFAGYAQASVDHFGTAHAAYEVWNEWNIRDVNGPAGATPQNYVALLAATAARVKATHPDATLAGPALAPMNDWQGWLDGFISAGGLDHLDAFSTHPYNFTAEPETFRTHVATLRQKFAAAGHPDLPIWFTEHGWYTTPNPPGVTPAVQARNLARAQLLSLGDGIGRYTVYDFKDDGTNPTDPEHNFGMIRNEADVRGAYVPKPAFTAQGVLTRQTAERPVRAVLSLGTGRYGVEFGRRTGESADTRMQALWALTPQTWSVQATGSVTVTNLYGGTTVVEPDTSGRVHVSVGAEPVYLRGALGTVTTGSPFSLAVTGAVGGSAPDATWHIANTGTSARPLSLVSDGLTTQATVPAGATQDVAAALAPAQVGQRTWTAVVREGGHAIGVLTAAAQVLPALQLTGEHALNAAGADVLRLRVRNRGTHAVRLDGVTWTLGGSQGTVLADAQVAGGATAVQDVPLTAFGAWSATVSGPATDSVSGIVVAASSVAVDVPYQTIQVDGVLDPALRNLPAQTLGEDEQVITGWQGPQDLGGSLWITHDDSRLYLTAQLVDDVHAQPARGTDIWQGDSLQVGSSPGWPGEGGRPVGEVGSALTDVGPVDLTRWLPVGGGTDGVTAVVKRDEQTKTTTYELAATWAAVGVDPASRIMAATIAVNENDGSGRRGWSTWGRGVAEAKDPSLFHALRLMPPGGDEVDLSTRARTIDRP